VRNFDSYDFKENPCGYFTWGKQKASTLSLTVIVVIEMLNALNALSDEASILTVGLFANPKLIFAIFLSVGLHCGICYIPFFSRIFGTRPLLLNDWLLVLLFTFPVIIIDEIIKIFVRARTTRALEQRRNFLHKK
jgi:Ca2+-transporting ATPase